MFLDGIEDFSVQLGYVWKDVGLFDKFVFNFIYYNFDVEELSVDYGFEVDFVVLVIMFEKLMFLVKYVNYNVDSFVID